MIYRLKKVFKITLVKSNLFYNVGLRCSTVLNENIGEDGKIVSWDIYDEKIKSLNLEKFKKGGVIF